MSAPIAAWIPSKSLLLPGDAVQGAPDAGARALIDAAFLSPITMRYGEWASARRRLRTSMLRDSNGPPSYGEAAEE